MKMASFWIKIKVTVLNGFILPIIGVALKGFAHFFAHWYVLKVLGN